MSGKVLFWVQHLLGVGHLARTATLARRAAEEGLEAVVASGGEPAPTIDVTGARLVQLPSARAVDIHFKVLHDADDAPIDDDWRARRRDATLRLFREERPDVLVTELFPFGRRQFRFEMEPLLAEAKPAGVPVVASVRDILVAPAKPERLVEMLERVRNWYDHVLVHGDPSLVPFERTFPHLSEISDRVAYTGYVVDERESEAGPDGHDEILVSAGGGAVAEPLLRAAVAAKPLTQARNARWRFLEVTAVTLCRAFQPVLEIHILDIGRNLTQLGKRAAGILRCRRAGRERQQHRRQQQFAYTPHSSSLRACAWVARS